MRNLSKSFPRPGNAVNLASRVQGASRYLKTTMVLTEATRRKLDANMPIRRLGRVEVLNKVEPVDLYELVLPEHFVEDLRIRYEEALGEFENGNFRMAARILGQIFTQYEDGPALVGQGQHRLELRPRRHGRVDADLVAGLHVEGVPVHVARPVGRPRHRRRQRDRLRRRPRVVRLLLLHDAEPIPRRARLERQRWLSPHQ